MRRVVVQRFVWIQRQIRRLLVELKRLLHRSPKEKRSHSTEWPDQPNISLLHQRRIQKKAWHLGIAAFVADKFRVKRPSPEHDRSFIQCSIHLLHVNTFILARSGWGRRA